MFHLTAAHLDHEPWEVVTQLQELTEVLASGYELPADALSVDITRTGYRTLGTSLVSALGALSSQLMTGSRSTHGEVFDFSTPQTPDMDSPDLVPPEGFVLADDLSRARCRLEHLRREAVTVEAEIERLERMTPSLTEPVPGRSGRPRSSIA